MEVLQGLFSSIWDGLQSLSVPIINMSFVDFLIALFVVKLMISVFNYLLSKSSGSSNTDKSKNG